MTGMALAGVYPPAIKIAAGWTVTRRGLAIGTLVAGATIGSALPYGLQIGTLATAWRQVQWMAALSGVLSAGCFLWLIREGPHRAVASTFNRSALRRVLSDRRVVLATGGYLGHMWELYAMWSSIGLFWGSLAQERQWTPASAPLLALLTVGAGAVGCLWAGVVADRIGRATTTVVAMTVSACCCLLIGPLRFAPAWALVVVALTWGASIVADSAQFSASVTEWADRSYVGTAVTVQTACGFLLTMITIGMVPRWAASWGWQWAYAPLALGPLVGIACMWRLRAHEAARSLARVA
jgi:MFS family permease